MCLGLSLQSNLAVELGLNDDEVAKLNAWSAVVAAASMVAGGYLSDRLGRRLMLSIYIACMGLPVLYLMSMLTQHGWIMPVSPNAPNRPEVPAALVTALWTASLVYSVVNGLMYGTRSAICMDVTNPRVAATQFTAYMALMNLTISYSAAWQGIAAEAWGYPKTMLVDVIFGAACLVAIPLMTHKAGAPFTDSRASGRARIVAVVLGLLCLAWLPYRMLQDAVGAAQPIAGTLFTLVFIGAALFLLAGRAVVGGSAPTLTRIGAWLAPLLLAMYARYHVDRIAGWLALPFARQALEAVLFAVPLCAGVVLLLLASRSWRELAAPAPAPA
jgi:PAT family beta-lactamase induction signal transducer AmpG